MFFNALTSFHAGSVLKIFQVQRQSNFMPKWYFQKTCLIESLKELIFSISHVMTFVDTQKLFVHPDVCCYIETFFYYTETFCASWCLLLQSDHANTPCCDTHISTFFQISCWDTIPFLLQGWLVILVLTPIFHWIIPHDFTCLFFWIAYTPLYFSVHFFLSNFPSE